MKERLSFLGLSFLHYFTVGPSFLIQRKKERKTVIRKEIKGKSTNKKNKLRKRGPVKEREDSM